MFKYCCYIFRITKDRALHSLKFISIFYLAPLSLMLHAEPLILEETICLNCCLSQETLNKFFKSESLECTLPVQLQGRSCNPNLTFSNNNCVDFAKLSIEQGYFCFCDANGVHRLVENVLYNATRKSEDEKWLMCYNHVQKVRQEHVWHPVLLESDQYIKLSDIERDSLVYSKPVHALYCETFNDYENYKKFSAADWLTAKGEMSRFLNAYEGLCDLVETKTALSTLLLNNIYALIPLKIAVSKQLSGYAIFFVYTYQNSPQSVECKMIHIQNALVPYLVEGQYDYMQKVQNKQDAIQLDTPSVGLCSSASRFSRGILSESENENQNDPLVYQLSMPDEQHDLNSKKGIGQVVLEMNLNKNFVPKNIVESYFEIGDQLLELASFKEESDSES